MNGTESHTAQNGVADKAPFPGRFVRDPSIHVPDADERMADRHSRMLRKLAEVCMEFVCEVQEALADASPEKKLELAPQIGPVLTNAARAVRQTVALEAKLADRRKDRKIAAEAAKAAQQAEEEAQAAFAKRGRELYRRSIVERVIEGTIGQRGDAENLLTDLYERLDDIERYESFTDRPIGEIAQRVSRSMGLTPDWQYWAKEPWAIAEARAQHPTSPFTGLKAEGEGDEDPDDPDRDDDDGGSGHNGRGPPGG